MFRLAGSLFAAFCICLVAPQAACAQDAAAVVAASSKAMGVDGLNALRIYGQATTFTLGQSNRAGGPWPAVGYNDYSRTYDFSQPALRTAAMFWSLPTGGKPGAARPYEQVVTPATQAWVQQLEIWTSPWGFLKGAAKYGAQVAPIEIDGRGYKVVTWSPPMKSPSGASYKVVGYIGPDNMVERTQTWVEESVFGDMEVETAFSTWRDANGVKFPSTTIQKKAGQVSFQLNSLGIAANPADLAALMTPAAGSPPPTPPASAAIVSEKLADDVYRIRGAYNSLAVGFRDYVVIFEPGPQNQARAQAVIAETKRLFPGKPIRYGVISHHHIDHTGGIAAVAAEGIVIVANEVNKPFLEEALNGPRTLGDDALAKSGKKAVIETFGDKRVFDDGRHSLEIHLIRGLPHADGLVVGYLPKEKILVYADMFNLPTAAQPVTNVIPTRIFLDNIERLGLTPERILSIHALVPDRLATMADIRGSLGLPN